MHHDPHGMSYMNGYAGATMYGGATAYGPMATLTPAALPNPVQHSGSNATSTMFGGHRFYGVVKTYSQINGYGFIGGDQVTQHIGKDIFLHQREVSEVTGVPEPHVPTGTVVSFTVNITPKGQPQARELMFEDNSFLLGQLGSAGGALPSLGNEVHGGKRFTGFVRSYSQVKGFGFIGGDDVMKTFGKDVFLHFREVGNIGNMPPMTAQQAAANKPFVPTGVWVSFQVTMNHKAQPQARDVRFEDQALAMGAGLPVTVEKDGQMQFQTGATPAMALTQQPWGGVIPTDPCMTPGLAEAISNEASGPYGNAGIMRFQKDLEEPPVITSGAGHSPPAGLTRVPEPLANRERRHQQAAVSSRQRSRSRSRSRC